MSDVYRRALVHLDAGIHMDDAIAIAKAEADGRER